MSSLKILFVALCIGSTYLPSCAQKYDSWKNVNEKGTGILTILYFESPGLIYFENGKMGGLCVETVNDFANYVNSKYKKKITIEYKKASGDFAGFLSEVQRSPNALGVSAVTVTAERQRNLKFTQSFLASPVMLVTSGDVPKLTALTEIKTLKPFSLKGGIYNESILQLQKNYSVKNEIKYINEPISLLERVASTPKSFTVLGMTDYLAGVKLGLKIKSQSITVAKDEAYGFVMAKGSDWDGVWKEFMTPQYLNSTQYKKWISDYLGASFLKFLNENY